MLNFNTAKSITAAVLMGLLLTACTTYGKYDEFKRETEKSQDRINSVLAESSYEKVKILDKPPRVISEIHQSDRPLWLADETKIVANKLPLTLVIKQIVGNDVPIQYGQAVDPYALISNFYFEGKKEEALNILSLTSNFGITPTKEGVKVEKFLTKTYKLPTVIGDEDTVLGSSGTTNTSSEDASSGEITSTGGGDGQYVNTKVDKYNLTDQIYKSITTILNGESNITTGTGDATALKRDSDNRESVLGFAEQIKGLSQIVVRTSPAMMKLIDEVVESTINEMTKEVELEVTVLEYQQTDGTEFGIDAALEKANSQITWGLNTVAPDLADTVDSFGLTGSVTSGSWTGTSLLINALRTSGDVSVESSQRIPATNHKTQEIDTGSVKAYFKSVEVTYDDDDNTSTDIEVGYLRDGVKMLALPNIQDDRVYLKLTGTLSKVLSTEDETVNEITVSKPTTRQSRFNITGAYEYNKPFIVTHMRQVTNEANKRRFADIEVGNTSSKRVVDTIVVVVPRLVAKPKSLATIL